MIKCSVCNKRERYGHSIFYSEKEYILCGKYYKIWLKEHKPYVDSHKNIKPATEEWKKMCIEEERLFEKWLEKVKHNV